MTFDMPDDAKARAWLHELIARSTFPGAQATEVIMVQAWVRAATVERKQEDPRDHESDPA